MVSHRSSLPSVHLLGPLSIRQGGHPINLGISGPTRDLLAYLLVKGATEVRRDYLMDLLWQDMAIEQARCALNTAVWRINKLLKRLRGLKLHSHLTSLRLVADPGVETDTLRLESTVRQAAQEMESNEAMGDDIRQQLIAAINCAHGEFLDGSSATWALIERERFSNLYMRGLCILMQDCGLRRAYEDALDYGRQILVRDPFRESVQRAVTWLYVLDGQRVQAIRHYKSYETLLARELGIRPMLETRALHDHILSDPEFVAEEPLVGVPKSKLHKKTSGDVCTIFAQAEHTRLNVFRAMVCSRIV